MKKHSSELESFIETALWSTIGDDDEHLDDKLSINDISEEFLVESQNFINSFMEIAEPFFTEDELLSSPITHDLWLTVEGHGAGFWDGDYVQGDKLTELVKSLQSYDSYFSEKLRDNLITEGN